MHNLLPAAVLLLAGCATASAVSSAGARSVEIVTADVPHLGSESGEARLTLRITAGNVPLTLTEADLSLDLDRVRVAEALISIDRVVPGGAPEALQIRLPISLRVLPAELGDRMNRGDAVELVVHGTLKGRQNDQPVTLPFEVLRSVHPAEGEAAAEPR